MALWTPNEIASSINAWLEADKITAPISTNISSAQDSGPDNRDWEVATSNPVTGPYFTTTGLAELNGLDFDGDGLQTVTTIGTGIVDFGVYAVWGNLEGAGTKRIVDCGWDTGFWVGRHITDANQIGGGIGDSTDPYGHFVTAATGAWHILSFERISGVKYITSDGGTGGFYSGAATQTAALGNSRLYMGCANAEQPSTVATHLWLGELLFLDANITVENRQKIEGYMAWKWALNSLLPTDHPYKNAAPTTGPISRFKIWTGSAWTLKPAKVWSGSAWVEKPAKVWNGSMWV
jgi:hypothetical protein